MSYILDALKKAEKERRRNVASELLTGSDAVSREPVKRSMWPYLLLVVLLINAGLFLWLFGPWNSKRPVPVAPQAERDRAASSVEIVKERFDVGRVTSLPSSPAASEINRLEARKNEGKSRTAKASPSAKTDKSLRSVRTVPDQSGKISERAKPDEVQEKAGTARSAARPATPDNQISADQKQAGKTVIPGGTKVYDMNELPQSVLSSLPNLSLSLHLYYADPSSRLISVKGRTLREGQELTAGLKLEEINPDGAVFSFQNYRFQVGLSAK